MSDPIFCPEHGNFASKEAFAEHMAKQHPDIVTNQKIVIKPISPIPPPQNLPPPPTTPLPPAPVLETKTQALPLILEYRYKGSCPKCNTPVSTIYFSDFLGKAVVTAYCKNCDEALEKKVVKPLNTIIKKEVSNERSTPRLPVKEAVRKKTSTSAQ